MSIVYAAANIITWALCAVLAYRNRRYWVALWIGLRGIPHFFAALSKDDLDGAFKGLQDAARYMDGE
jgi:hypothetical protein